MSLINQITTIGPHDAIICSNRIHHHIKECAIAERDKQIAKWLRERADVRRRNAGFFNNNASYALALEVAAEALECDRLWDSRG